MINPIKQMNAIQGFNGILFLYIEYNFPIYISPEIIRGLIITLLKGTSKCNAINPVMLASKMNKPL